MQLHGIQTQDLDLQTDAVNFYRFKIYFTPCHISTCESCMAQNKPSIEAEAVTNK